MKRVAALFLLCSSCASANGLDGRDALVNIADEPAGSACEHGGIKIDAGLDRDADGTLDPDEVEDSRYVCQAGEGSPGSVTRVTEVGPGEDCEAGGVRIEVGTDADRDGALDDDEVESAQYVCSGVDGADGAPGADGEDGTNGTNGVDGQDGEDGLGYLTMVTDVPANGICGAESGVRIDAGPDTNRNGTLDFSEIVHTETLCDGSDGVDGADGGALFASSYNANSVTSSGAAPNPEVTAVTVTIVAPGPGRVVVFGGADVFCDPDAAPRCHSSGTTAVYLRVVDSPSADPTTGEGAGYMFLADNATENVTRSNVFTVPAAGTYNYYLRAAAIQGEVGLYRSQLTAVYTPD